MKPFKVLNEGDDVYIDWDFWIEVGIVVFIELAIFIPIGLTIVFLQKKYRLAQISKVYKTHLKNVTDVQIHLIELYTKLGRKDFLKLMNTFIDEKGYLIKEKEFLDAYEKVNETRQRNFLFFISRKLKYTSPFSISHKYLLEHNLLKKDLSGHFEVAPELQVEVESSLKQFAK